GRRVVPAGELLHLVVGDAVRTPGGPAWGNAQHGELLLHVGAREEARQLAALGLALCRKRLIDADQGGLGLRRVRQGDEAHGKEAADETAEERFHWMSP